MKKFFVLGLIFIIFLVVLLFLQKTNLLEMGGRINSPDIQENADDSCDIFSEKDCKCIVDPHGCKDLDKTRCEKHPSCYSFSRGGTCDCPSCLIWLDHQCLPMENITPGTTVQSSVENSKSCNVDNDCVLWMCAGCVNQEWANTAPPDLPCARYSDYSGCECLDGKCIEVK